jgi:FMN phosphatase YigB (HAD superfamily)
MHDVAGARRAGLRGILIARGPGAVPADDTIEVIRSLNELPALIGGARAVAEVSA